MTEAEKELLALLCREGLPRMFSARLSEEGAEILRRVRRERFEKLETGWRERAIALLKAHNRAELEWIQMDSKLQEVLTTEEHRALIEEAFPKESP